MQLESAGVQRLQVFQGPVSSHGELGVPRGEQVKDAGLEIHVLHLQDAATLLGGHLHRVGPSGAGPERAGAPQAQPVLLDQLVLGAAMQTELEAGALRREAQGLLRHTDGEGEVAAHLADDDGAADVAGLDLHLAGGRLFYDAQAAGSLLPPSGSCAVAERQRQVLGGRLINLLLRAALVTLKDQRDLQRRRKATSQPGENAARSSPPTAAVSTRERHRMMWQLTRLRA
uniref:Uncharacterized protein n=1 Tax=Chelydra serpentina TaxID=8475 RepID=A0A8C3ST96_CHESE